MYTCICHMSHVTCHMSHVTSHRSHVTCHISEGLGWENSDFLFPGMPVSLSKKYLYQTHLYFALVDCYSLRYDNMRPID